MYKYFIHIISVILTSFYFFPFETVALPGVNTKMVLAGVSLLILGKRLAQRRDADINKDFFHVVAVGDGGIIGQSGNNDGQ